MVSEREQQTLKRLFLSPLSGVSYFLGIFLAHSVIGIGQTLVIFAIATFAGATFPGAAWLLAMLIIWLSILSYVGLGFMLGTQFARRTEDVSALIAAFGVPLMVLGGAFLPIALFPDSLLDIARFNPIYHMTEALSDALLNADAPLRERRSLLVFVGFRCRDGRCRLAFLSADANARATAVGMHDLYPTCIRVCTARKVHLAAMSAIAPHGYAQCPKPK